MSAAVIAAPQGAAWMSSWSSGWVTDMSERDGPEVVSRDDRELFLDPVLGCEYMADMMRRDRETWIQVSTLIVKAFVAGKAAERAAVAGSPDERRRAWPSP